MSTTQPNVGITSEYAVGEDGWAAGMNRNLRALDRLCQANVIDKDLTAPPGTPTNGDAYLLLTGLTGAWSGQDDKIAVWDAAAGAWDFHTPKEGWLIHVNDEDVFYKFDGADWAVLETGGGAAVSSPNMAINGGCLVAQRSAPSLASGFLYGAVDRMAGRASAGSISAGTISQNTAATIGSTGRSFRFAGVTLGAGGVLQWRYRMEAKDAVQFKDDPLTIAMNALHDVGAAVDYTFTINKADAADNFSSVTFVEAGSTQSVPSATDTEVAHTVADMGDCSNGIEIVLTIDCGAVTTKNFDIADVRILPASAAAPLVPKPYADEEAACLRYFEHIDAGFSQFCVTVMAGTGATSARGTLDYTKKRAVPTVVFSDPSGWEVRAGSGITLTSLVANADRTSVDMCQIDAGAASGISAGTAYQLEPLSGGNFITVDAEL